MRRPVCLFGLAFVVIWSILLSVIPRQMVTCEMLDKQRITVAGVVESKEHKLQNQKEILVVSVKQVCVLQPEEVSYLQQVLSTSDNDSETIKIWKQYVKQRSKDKLCENDITGLLCYMEEGQEPAIGSLVLISGKFRTFPHATNPGEFDSANYYQINRIQGRLMQSTLEYESPFHHVLQEKLYQCRVYLGMLLDAAYPADKAAIMRAMLLGEKGTLDADVKALYQQNGIIHILAISGVKTLKLDIPLVPETRINWAFMPLHIVIIYILKLCLDEEIIPRCRFPCSRGYFKKCINWQKK